MWLHSSPAAPSPPSQLEFIGHKFTPPRLRFLGFIWSCSYNFKFPARIFPVVKYSFCDLWPLFSLTSLSCCWWRIMKLILFTKAPNVWCDSRCWKQPDTFKLSSNRTAAVCVAVCSVLFCRHLRQTHYTDNYKHTQQTRVCLLPPLHVKTKRRH